MIVSIYLENLTVVCFLGERDRHASDHVTASQKSAALRLSA